MARAPSLSEALAQASAPSLDDVLATDQPSYDFGGFAGGNRIGERALANKLAESKTPEFQRETKARDAATARKAKPIEADSEIERMGETFWQRVRGLGGGGGRLALTGLEEIGIDPNGDAAQWLRGKTQSAEEYAARPIEGAAKAPTIDDIRKGNVGIGNLARFVLEQGASSVADMGVLASGVGILPYVGLQTGSTAQQRAENNNQSDATADDVFKALPSAVASAALEKIGMHGIFGAGAKSVVGRIAQAFGTEALTEAIQSPIEYAGSNLGTDAGFDPMEAANQAVAGAIAGGAMGGGIRGAIETPGAIARRVRGAPVAPGVIEAAETAAPVITPEDEASPIPTELIAEGKRVAGTATASTDANRILSDNGAPAVGSKVTVNVGGKPRTGTVRDAFVDESDADLGAQPGLSIDLDGGGTMREFFADLNDAGVSIEAAGIDPAAMDRAIADMEAGGLSPASTLDAIAETGETPVVPSLDELTPAPAPAAPRVPSGGAFDTNAYMARARRAESGGDDGAANTRSSASGRYQFTDSTFARYYAKVYGGNPPAGSKNDPVIQDRLMKAMTDENIAGLKASGIAVNDSAVYAAHHFGLGGAREMYRDPVSPVDAAIVKANPQFKGMTNAQALAWVGNHIGAQPGAPTAPSSRPSPIEEADRERLVDEPLTTQQVEATARAPDEAPAPVPEATTEPVAQAAGTPAAPEAGSIVNYTDYRDGTPVGGTGTVQQIRKIGNTDYAMLDNGKSVALSEITASTPGVTPPASAAAPASAPTSTVEPAQAPTLATASAYTITETPSGKGIAIANLTDEQKAAISTAVPKASATPSKSGLVFAAKYRAQIEEALSSSTPATTPAAEPVAAPVPVTPAPRDKPRVRSGPIDAVTFLADLGGIQDTEGHALKQRARGQGAGSRDISQFAPGGGHVFRKGGMTIDEAGEALQEAGYFTERPTTTQVLEMLDRSAFENQYRPADIPDVEQRRAERRDEQDREGARVAASAALDEIGLTDANEADIEGIAAFMSDGRSSGEAVESYYRQQAEARSADYYEQTNDDEFDIPFDGPAARSADFGNVEGFERSAPVARAAAGSAAPGRNAVEDRGAQADAFGERDGDQRRALERAGEGRSRASVAQKAAGSDGGLFDNNASQPDLLSAPTPDRAEQLRKQGAKPAPAPAPVASSPISEDERAALTEMRNREAKGSPDRANADAILRRGSLSDRPNINRVESEVMARAVADRAEPAPAPAPAEPTPAKYGTENKLVTTDRAEVIRQKLRAKMNNINSGIDPEVLALGAELSVYHIEAGARKFADFSNRMIADIGESVRPFLRSFYESARYYPGMDAVARDMSTAAQIEEEGNAASISNDLEPDSGGTVAEDSVREAPVPDAGTGDGRGPGEGSGRTRSGGRSGTGEAVVPEDDATAVGAASNQRVRDGSPGDAGRAANARDGGGGGADGVEGPTVDHIPTAAVKRSASNSTDLTAKAAAQKRANDVAVRLGDRDNIAKTLPYLHEGQQDDVLIAEKRFAAPNGHGVLFTNGTGTGKTFSGGGVVARMYRQGGTEQLIMAPSQDILKSWVDALDRLGIPATILGSTDEAGSGVSLTTYANAASNNALASRDFDLVVADESHKLSSNKDGDTTTTLEAFRAFTNHPRGLYERAKRQLSSEWAPFDDLERRKIKLNNVQEATRAELAGRTAARAKTFQGNKRPPAVMLSATPFAYVEAIDYAEGYLFDYPDVGNARYNEPDGRQQFYIQNFGYRMRTGKLTKPEAGVDSGVMEREFHELLKRDGSLSGRVLDVDADYDRKFVLVDDAVGNDIDKALEFLSSGEDGKFRPLYDIVSKRFDYLSRMRLLEAVKATHAVDMIRQYHEDGRKVVVFHDYNEGGGFSPFVQSFGPEDTVEVYVGNTKKKVNLFELNKEFLAANPYVEKLDFQKFGSPIETLKAAFPTALIYNGSVPAKERTRAKEAFNKDGPDTPNLIVVQSAAGEAGISLHDTTGGHMRVTINLGMPVRPTTAIQEEGRTYRDGQVTNAAFRYLNTGTAWERWTFAGKLAERAGTAENLALGNLARSLKQSFVDSFSDSQPFAMTAEDGVGGKAADRANNTMSPFERAKTYYWAQQKQTGNRNQREGIDYFATPEPLGFKMAEMANIGFGERVLEPSAGHGAIARFLPESSDRTLVEPSANLISRAALASPGARTLMERFEDMHISNKFDAIVMNPPYGSGGKTAIDHLAKAGKHLRNGGRMVALIPEGPSANKRFDAWRESEDSKSLHVVADIKLPSSTFERAGTLVMTRLVIVDKQSDASVAARLSSKTSDLTGAETIGELFDRLEALSVPDRLKPVTVDKEPIPANATKLTVDGIEVELIKVGSRMAVKPRKMLTSATFARLARLARQAGGDYQNADRAFGFDTAESRTQFLEAVNNGEIGYPSAGDVAREALPTFESAETVNSKSGAPQYVAVISGRVDRAIYDNLLERAKARGGWYSYFTGKGAVPGFQFKTAAARDAYLSDMRATQPAATAPEGAKLSLDDDAIGDDADAYMDSDYEALRAKLAAQAKRMGVGGDRLVTSVVSKIMNDDRIAGMYFNGVITIATDVRASPERTFNHEFIHALKDMGLFRDAEWTVLSREARTDPKLMKKIAGRYPNLDEEGRIEEAVAEMFADWKGERTGFRGAALGRIRDFIDAIRRLIRGVDTSGDIMRRINAGTVGARDGSAQSTSTPRHSVFGIPDRNSDPQTMAEAMERAKTFLGRRAEGWENWRVAMQDRMAPVLRGEAKAEQVLGRPLLDTESAYLNEEVMTGRTEDQLDKVEEMTDRLWAALDAEKITTSELESFLYAKHAPERNAHIASINTDFTQGEGSGMTDVQAAAILARIDNEGRTKEFERVAQQVYDMIAFARDTRHEGGLLTDEQYDSWQNDYQFYVPLRGFKEIDGENGDLADNAAPRVGQGLTVRGSESKRAFGRRSEADDIIAHSIIQVEEAVVRAEKNRPTRAMYEMVKALGDKAEGFATINKVTMKRRMNPLSGLVESYPVYAVSGEDSDWTVSTKIDGKEYRVTFNKDNPQARKMAEAMRRLDERQTLGALQLLSKYSRWKSKVSTTLVPSFVITNMFRDIQAASINLVGVNVDGILKGTLRDYRKALAASTKGAFGKKDGEWGRWWREFSEEGGRVAFNQMSDLSTLRKEMERRFDPKNRPNPDGMNRSPKQLAMIAKGDVIKIFDTIDKVNTGVENAVRLAVYKNAREAGVSPIRAASLAKNITTNFNRRGTKGAQINALYLFYNAGVQGSARIMTALRNPGVQKVVAGIVALGAAQELMNMMMSVDDDDDDKIYDKIPEYEKQRNMIIMLPSGSYLKFAMPYGYSAFHSLGRNLAKAMRGEKDTVIMSNILTAFAESFNPVGSGSLLNMVAPTIVDPMVDLQQNRNFAGRPIMPDQPQFGPPDPDNQRFWNKSGLWNPVTDTLNKVSGGDKVVAGAIDVSPETLKYMFGEVTGGAGRFIQQSATAFAGMFTEEGRDELTINDIPMANRVVGKKSKSYDKAAFYARLSEVEGIVDNTKKYALAGDKDTTKAYIDKERPTLGLMDIGKAAKNAMRDIRHAKAATEQAKEKGTLDAEEYKERRKKLADAEKMVIDTFNKRYLAVIEKPVRP